ncbi:MAG TPA: methyltransferase domain-containing protein [Vicinamibacterales bacterium]
MGLFRKSAPGEPLAVTMAGVRLGNRFLAVGVRDPALVAVLAGKAGLTGTACAVDADEAAVRKAAAAIEADGALVDVTRAPWGMWPYDAGSFDVAVIRDLLPTLTSGSRANCVSEVLRVLRPGGRALVIEPAPRGGFGALLNRQTIDPDYRGAVKTLQQVGFAAVRELAERDGVLYVEGIKKTG